MGIVALILIILCIIAAMTEPAEIEEKEVSIYRAWIEKEN